MNAGHAFKSILTNFLGNYRSLNYESVVERLLRSLQALYKHAHKYIFSQLAFTQTIFQKTVVVSTTSNTNGFTRILEWWKRVTKADGVSTFLRTTVGASRNTLQMRTIDDTLSESRLLHIISFRRLYNVEFPINCKCVICVYSLHILGHCKFGFEF